jgi:hypothetical protein
VLIDQGLSLPEPQPRSKSAKKPWPDWLVWQPNRIWIWDATHFTRSRRVCFAIVDMVSRKWIDTLVSIEETATQVQVIFEHALEVEGLLELLTDERLDLDTDDPRRPILLAVLRQRSADESPGHPRLHGADGDRPTPRPSAYPSINRLIQVRLPGQTRRADCVTSFR